MGMVKEKTSRRVYPNLVKFFDAPDSPTATELAAELGISNALLSSFKWKTREPGLALALELHERCNIPLESLVIRQRRRVR